MIIKKASLIKIIIIVNNLNTKYCKECFFESKKLMKVFFSPAVIQPPPITFLKLL